MATIGRCCGSITFPAPQRWLRMQPWRRPTRSTHWRLSRRTMWGSACRVPLFEPVGQVPTLEDGDLVLTESVAIMLHLAIGFPKLISVHLSEPVLGRSSTDGSHISRVLCRPRTCTGSIRSDSRPTAALRGHPRVCDGGPVPARRLDRRTARHPDMACRRRPQWCRSVPLHADAVGPPPRAPGPRGAAPARSLRSDASAAGRAANDGGGGARALNGVPGRGSSGYTGGSLPAADLLELPERLCGQFRRPGVRFLCPIHTAAPCVDALRQLCHGPAGVRERPRRGVERASRRVSLRFRGRQARTGRLRRGLGTLPPLRRNLVPLRWADVPPGGLWRGLRRGARRGGRTAALGGDGDARGESDGPLLADEDAATDALGEAGVERGRRAASPAPGRAWRTWPNRASRRSAPPSA